MAYVVQISGTDPADGTAKSYRFAHGAGVLLTDLGPCPSGLQRWSSPTQKVQVAASGNISQPTADQGQIIISNAPDDVGAAGPYDALMGYVWSGQIVRLFWIPGSLWSERIQVARGRLQQPVSDRSEGSSVTSTLTFPVVDPRAGLDVPLQRTTYLGTGGLEGGVELIGKPKPIVYGTVFNTSPVLIDAARLIYQVADRAILSVLAVRDGGSPLTFGTGRASFALLQSTVTKPGKWDRYIGVEGTFIRIGTKSVFQICCDAREGANGTRDHANIWSRIRLIRCRDTALMQDAANIAATKALDSSREAGFFWGGDNQISRRDALDEVLQSFSGYEVYGNDDIWRVYKLTAPATGPVLRMVMLTEGQVLGVSDREMISFQRVRPSFAPGGSPPCRMTLNYQQNFTVLDPGSLAGVVTDATKKKLTTQWATTTANALEIYDPSTDTGLWIDAPELTVNSGYQYGPDGLTSPDASAEALRLLTLYKANQPWYQCSFRARPTDQVLPGMVLGIVHPGYGLSAGKAFVVLQSNLIVEGGDAVWSVVVAFQS